MRQYKFRCWDVESERWVEQVDVMQELAEQSLWNPERSQWYIITQFTGLTDKNGKEIYEGDIGEIKTQSGRIERFTVEWGIHRRDMKSGWAVDIPSFAFMVDGKATFPISDNYLNGHDLDIIEIIGNLYETPDLLTPQPNP